MRRAGGSTRVWNMLTGMFWAVCCAAIWSALWAGPVPAQETKPDLFTRLDADKNGKVSREELPEPQSRTSVASTPTAASDGETCPA